jgi:hypothetical protein
MPAPPIAADGVALHAIPASGGRVVTLAKWMLLYHDFLTWCGTRLVASVGPIRDSTLGKYLVTAKPPRWRAARLVRTRSRSWVSPACSPSGATIAAAAGRNFGEPRFGLEHRSLWLLPASGGSVRRLTVPPAGATDESPRWSRDGRSLLFVRTRHFFGHLYLVRRNGALTGPIARVGWNPPYYGTYGWGDQLDWYQAH